MAHTLGGDFTRTAKEDKRLSYWFETPTCMTTACGAWLKTSHVPIRQNSNMQRHDMNTHGLLKKGGFQQVIKYRGLSRGSDKGLYGDNGKENGNYC